MENVLRKQGRNQAVAQAALEGESFWRKEILKIKNEPAKDFELRTIKGERIKLSALKGKIVTINFRATRRVKFCSPDFSHSEVKALKVQSTVYLAFDTARHIFSSEFFKD